MKTLQSFLLIALVGGIEYCKADIYCKCMWPGGSTTRCVGLVASSEDCENVCHNLNSQYDSRAYVTCMGYEMSGGGCTCTTPPQKGEKQKQYFNRRQYWRK